MSRGVLHVYQKCVPVYRDYLVSIHAKHAILNRPHVCVHFVIVIDNSTNLGHNALSTEAF